MHAADVLDRLQAYVMHDRRAGKVLHVPPFGGTVVLRSTRMQITRAALQPIPNVDPALQAKQSRLQTATLESIRKTSFNELEPQMEFLRRMRERMGERYPEAMFLPPVLVTDEEKEHMIRAMRVSSHPSAVAQCYVHGWHTACCAEGGCLAGVAHTHSAFCWECPPCSHMAMYTEHRKCSCTQLPCAGQAESV
jgi:hypothetical protein